MTTGSVGVTKKRVRVIEQPSSTHSIEYEQEVYVVDTTDETLTLQTGTESGGVDLTGSNSIGTASSADTIIGANNSGNTTVVSSPTITIGTTDSAVSIGTLGGADTIIGANNSGNTTNIQSALTMITSGANASTIIGANLTSNTCSILSREVTIGDSAGDRSIYIGSPSTTETGPNSIYIGGKTSTVQIGRVDSSNPNSTLDIKSRTINIGSNAVTGSTNNQNSLVSVYGDSVAITSKANIDLTCAADFTVTASDDITCRAADTTTLDSVYVTNSGTRTMYSLVMDKLSTVHNTHTYHSGNVDITSGAAQINNLNGLELYNKKSAKLSMVGDYYDSSAPSATLQALNGIRLVGNSGALNGEVTDEQGSYLDLKPNGMNMAIKGSGGGVYTETDYTTYSISSKVNSIFNASVYSSLEATSIQATLTTSGASGKANLVTTADSIVIATKDSGNSTIGLAGFNTGVGGASTNQFYSYGGFFAGGSGYAPFTGVHMFSVAENEDIQVGDAVVLLNKLAYKSSSANSKTCVGIAISVNSGVVEVAAVGDTECGQLKGFKVCDENGAITAGDLLVTSSRPGYLMKQPDDIVRSTTVGKSASEVVFDQSGLATDIYGFIYCG